MEEIEIDCPVCDDGKKHKAIVLQRVKSEKKNREILEVKCKDCGSVGRIIRLGDIDTEIYDFSPPEAKAPNS